MIEVLLHNSIETTLVLLIRFFMKLFKQLLSLTENSPRVVFPHFEFIFKQIYYLADESSLNIFE